MFVPCDEEGNILEEPKETDFLNKQNDMKGKFIKVLDEEHGKRVIAFFKYKGVDTFDYNGTAINHYYGIHKLGYFGHFIDFPDPNMGENPELIELPNEKVYPKVMRVSDEPLTFENDGYTRVVFMEKKGKFIAWSDAETIEEAEKETETYAWSYAKDIDDPIFQVKQMTKEEIEKELGYKIEIV